MAMAASVSSAFVATGSRKRAFVGTSNSVASVTTHLHSTVTATPTDSLPVENPTPSPEPPKKELKPKKAPKAANHKNGVFSPAVHLAKAALGEKKLNKIRADVISLHSDVIGNFVGTSNSGFGQATLRTLFQAADKNGNGSIEEEELAKALQTLGFDWLKEKQIKGIFKRADTDESGTIDLEEFLREAPKTLRTNLVKLAKKNGGDMGLLV